MQVVSEELDFAFLEKCRDNWSECLVSSGNITNTNDLSLLPLRLAVLMADIRSQHDDNISQTNTNIEYMAEWIDFAFKKLGYDIEDYAKIWDEYYKSWQLVA